METEGRNNTEPMSVKETILYSVLGLVAVGGTFFIGRKLIRKGIAGKEEQTSWQSGSAAGYAKQIKMAFENDGWWGTDMPALRKAIISIPTKQLFRDVMASYGRLYNKNMMQDLKDELQVTQYNEMLQIIDVKPEKTSAKINSGDNYLPWARRLKAAFDKSYGPLPGTDEEAIKAVFIEMPTQKDFALTAIAYKKEYGNDLLKDLQSELEFWEYSPMMDIILKKPK